jgi:hypothetical protein
MLIYSHQTPTLLTVVSRLSRNRICPSLPSLGTDRIENTSSNSSSIVASSSYYTNRVENPITLVLFTAIT